MEINAVKPVKVNAKTLAIHMKVCDGFTCELKDAQGDILKEYEGYVPDIMPGQHFGDYVILDIDIDTGQVTNWKVPSVKQVQDFIKSDEEE